MSYVQLPTNRLPSGQSKTYAFSIVLNFFVPKTTVSVLPTTGDSHGIRCGRYCETSVANCLVPPVGVEPTLLAELDFESSMSTNSITRAKLCILLDSNQHSRFLQPRHFHYAKYTGLIFTNPFTDRNRTVISMDHRHTMKQLPVF